MSELSKCRALLLMNLVEQAHEPVTINGNDAIQISQKVRVEEARLRFPAFLVIA